jgi:iron complex transport system substrate-binding protein
MRIASLLPSATEIVYALGLGDELAGVTHECDFPAAARTKPALTRNLLPAGLGSAAIDAAVTASQRDAHTIYALDADLLGRLQPDLVLTQSLCEVCAVPRSAVDEAVCSMPGGARVLSLDPSSLDDVLGDVERVGEATGRLRQAAAVVAGLRARVEAVKLRAANCIRPRVFCAEWLDPIFCAGHWLPQMVELAGGQEALGRPFQDSVRIGWEAVLDYAPEVIVMMPCGFDAPGALREAGCLTSRPGWSSLPAVREARVFIVDANALFARPGPRLVDGLELLARILHPTLFPAVAGAWCYKLVPGATDGFEPYC